MLNSVKKINSVTDRRTDGPTDGRTDGPTQCLIGRVACNKKHRNFYDLLSRNWGLSNVHLSLRDNSNDHHNHFFL